MESSSLVKAKTALDQGMELLDAHQKLIEIADRSEFCCRVVVKYEADELASDSDDDKKLEKAERTAERRAAKRKKPTGGAVSRSFYKARQASAGGYQAIPLSRPFGYQTAYQTTQQNTIRSKSSVPKPLSVPGPCFA